MKKLGYLLAALAFVLSIYLVIKGQTIASPWGLTMMLVGLGGLLVNLYMYNRKYR